MPTKVKKEKTAAKKIAKPVAQKRTPVHSKVVSKTHILKPKTAVKKKKEEAHSAIKPAIKHEPKPEVKLEVKPVQKHAPIHPVDTGAVQKHAPIHQVESGAVHKSEVKHEAKIE
ncbi:MAG: hypothetical protein M0R17_13520, partial [Candidatus Omnitrophica bacterium]|nr:hypothetical protein [Candidatus Omnitrophota bacterium]